MSDEGSLFGKNHPEKEICRLKRVVKNTGKD
jgi:hypothetical protein